MKFTQYFFHTRNRLDRISIKNEWIEQVITSPIKEEKQKDGRIRKWGHIKEAENRILRIVILEDGETVHNAFFDRSFKEK